MNAFEDMLRLIASLPDRRPAAGQPRALERLFADLLAGIPPRPHGQTEDMIWVLWSGHSDPALARRLGLASRAIPRGEYERAERLLNPLVRDHPDWAEAWNKRATVRYLGGRDAASVADIRRTLELEPRHFGALCGFAQICLRRGERAWALLAFEAALRIHPHLGGVRPAADELRETLAATAH